MRRLMALAAVTMVVVACAGKAATPPPTVPTALAGTQWILGAQGGTAPASTNPPTITFASDGGVAGFSGCTTYTASYTTTGSDLAITNVVKDPTQNPCAPQTVAAEDAYLQALAASTTWQSGDLSGAVPSGVLVLAPVKLLLGGGPTPLIFTLS